MRAYRRPSSTVEAIAAFIPTDDGLTELVESVSSMASRARFQNGADQCRSLDPLTGIVSDTLLSDHPIHPAKCADKRKKP